ncbi:hypothetical protein SUGI_0084980 [Cryptomeria japonica]|nr:hypothetical protein SUGI_0084980 [Cryptomeria japonica]
MESRIQKEKYCVRCIAYGKRNIQPKEPVNAVTYYQEKFGRKTSFSNNRLSSPTPSEDNEEEEASNQGLEVSSYVANTLPKQVTEESEMRPIGFDGNLS